MCPITGEYVLASLETDPSTPSKLKAKTDSGEVVSQTAVAFPYDEKDECESDLVNMVCARLPLRLSPPSSP